MNSYKLTIVETQSIASHCSIKRSAIETQSIAFLCSIKSSPIETQCLASHLFDQKITDRDAKHCVSTLGLAILKIQNKFSA
ncbi:MAG: hypothetical protein LBB88_09105 [Planctomycetaceae bacterium]|nr:hypothetical protein [Planctomycetaceae bacterium]